MHINEYLCRICAFLCYFQSILSICSISFMIMHYFSKKRHMLCFVCFIYIIYSSFEQKNKRTALLIRPFAFFKIHEFLFRIISACKEPLRILVCIDWELGIYLYPTLSISEITLCNRKALQEFYKLGGYGSNAIRIH